MALFVCERLMWDQVLVTALASPKEDPDGALCAVSKPAC